MKFLGRLYEEGRIPYDLYKALLDDCPYCGYKILTSDNLKHRKCSNYFCRGHVKERAVGMFKFLGIPGYGPAKSLELLQVTNSKHHCQLIPFVTKEKPYLHLWEIAKVADIPGYSDKLEEIFVGYTSFEDFFLHEKFIPEGILSFKDYLIECEKYFDVRPPLAQKSITVMITGEIQGYRPRDKFIKICNDIVGNVIRIKLANKGQERDYLITENKEANTQKIITARQNRIPIVTPKEFIYLLGVYVRNQNKEGSEHI